MNTEIPEMIGKYKVISLIAQGGMGAVYKAIHPSLKRYVVIKKMIGKNKSGNAERFKKEAQILLDLQSPYIVHLFDYFTEGSFRYMVEELVDGMALDKLIKRQYSLPVPLAMLIMQDSCYALKYAHSKDIVHRDIKPGNILISKRGEIKLADFGIASDSQDQELTKSTVALGTPAYMPPEQFENSSKVDSRADIYALGIMLYEMVTGTKPYSGEFTTENLKIIKSGKYIRPRKIDKTIPKEIEKLIHKMIRPKAKSRFQSIEQVLRKVKKFLKHYDTHEIRVQLAKSVISLKPYDFVNLQPKDKRSRFVKKNILSVASFLVICAFAWKSGFIYNFILRPWFKPVSFEVIMPRSSFNKMDLPMKITFYENDNKEIPEVKNSSRNFNVKGTKIYEKIYTNGVSLEHDRPTALNKTYTMFPVWLKKGDYRAKLVVGPYVWWNSFTVGDEPFTYTCDFLKNMKRPLNINAFAYDSTTMENITENTNFQINYKNHWVSLNEIENNELESGSVWKIKASAEGYEDEIFSLLIDWYQDQLFVSASLKKIED